MAYLRGGLLQGVQPLVDQEAEEDVCEGPCDRVALQQAVHEAQQPRVLQGACEQGLHQG